MGLIRPEADPTGPEQAPEGQLGKHTPDLNRSSGLLFSTDGIFISVGFVHIFSVFKIFIHQCVQLGHCYGFTE